MNLRILLCVLLVILSVCNVTARAQHHHHADGSPPVDRPKVFLDKTPRIVWYQLNRLDNQRLLLVERNTGDLKYAPVYTAILTRDGMSRQHREEALSGLVDIHKSDATTQLLQTLGTIDADDPQQRRTGRVLAEMLLAAPPEELAAKADALEAATQSAQGFLRRVGYAGLISAGRAEAARQIVAGSQTKLLDWLAGIALVPAPERRKSLRDSVAALVDPQQPAKIRRAAVAALAHVPSREGETFQLVAPLVGEEALRTAAVRTLLRIPQQDRDARVAAELTDVLVRHAETTPAAQRTTDEFIDAMQLADQLLGRIPVEKARSYRQRLWDVPVRVVRIHTVEEEMRYDTPFFAVEAGRPVQVVLKNEDLMAHNLVITRPDALKEVALAGAQLGPNPGFEDKYYVPESENVLFATGLVPAGKQVRLTFTAPRQLGEYPYVCTFPNHWMRMYGVMVVVEDLDAWLANPTPPADPLGLTRTLVRNWSLGDFPQDLAATLHSRDHELGAQIFQEATCLQCHKIGNQGGAVGPNLAEVFARHQQDDRAVLREMLDPSYKVDPEYTLYNVLTLEGKVVSGIVTKQDRRSITVITNPEDPKPQVISLNDVDEMIKTSTSMMPKGLLDRFTQEEIFDLLAYLKHASAQPHTGQH